MPRAEGDAVWRGPNPSLRAIERAPSYAVNLYPGDIGAAAGLRTDAPARVLDAQGAPIPWLYAVGNDMHSRWAARTRTRSSRSGRGWCLRTWRRGMRRRGRALKRLGRWQRWPELLRGLRRELTYWIQRLLPFG